MFLNSQHTGKENQVPQILYLSEKRGLNYLRVIFIERRYTPFFVSIKDHPRLGDSQRKRVYLSYNFEC